MNLRTPESRTVCCLPLRPDRTDAASGFRTPNSAFRVPRSAFRTLRTQTAFSLIEILVVIALLSFIILGLLAMFDQTKRAFTTGMTQVDVLENGRAAMEMISRELSQIIPAPYDSNAVTFYAEIAPVEPFVQVLPGTDTTPPIAANERSNVLSEMFFLTRDAATNAWRGIGYWVGDPGTGNIRKATDNGWGTLFRYQLSTVFRSPVSYPWQLYGGYYNPDTRTQRMKRIIDGVVHFKVRAYDTNGVWISPSSPWFKSITNRWADFVLEEVGLYRFTNNAVPAFVEFELGILEERVLARVKSIPETDLAARRNYLREQVGRVHIFRTRVPVRNVDPAAYQ